MQKIIEHKSKILGFFPGSTIGNFCPQNAKKLLKKFAKILEKNNYLVIGVDLRKDIKIMEKAYNDSEGITAQFNKNILLGINKNWSKILTLTHLIILLILTIKKKRIEMHLISKEN